MDFRSWLSFFRIVYMPYYVDWYHMPKGPYLKSPMFSLMFCCGLSLKFWSRVPRLSLFVLGAPNILKLCFFLDICLLIKQYIRSIIRWGTSFHLNCWLTDKWQGVRTEPLSNHAVNLKVFEAIKTKWHAKYF